MPLFAGAAAASRVPRAGVHCHSTEGVCMRAYVRLMALLALGVLAGVLPASAASAQSRPAQSSLPVNWDFATAVVHSVQSASVGDRRAARRAGSRPAAAPMSSAAPRPPAQARGGMTTAQPLLVA